MRLGVATNLDNFGRHIIDMVVVDACNELMGHAGAVVLHTDDTTDAATDPRSDGKAFAQPYTSSGEVQ